MPAIYFSPATLEAVTTYTPLPQPTRGAALSAPVQTQGGNSVERWLSGAAADAQRILLSVERLGQIPAETDRAINELFRTADTQVGGALENLNQAAMLNRSIPFLIAGAGVLLGRPMLGGGLALLFVLRQQAQTRANQPPA